MGTEAFEVDGVREPGRFVCGKRGGLFLVWRGVPVQHGLVEPEAEVEDPGR